MLSGNPYIFLENWSPVGTEGHTHHYWKKRRMCMHSPVFTRGLSHSAGFSATAQCRVPTSLRNKTHFKNNWPLVIFFKVSPELSCKGLEKALYCHGKPFWFIDQLEQKQGENTVQGITNPKLLLWGPKQRLPCHAGLNWSVWDLAVTLLIPQKVR